MKGQENSASYAKRRKAEQADALRERIKAANYLTDIEKDLNRFIDADELPVVKFKTETRLKLLSKILPDLKAVEVEGSGENGEMVVQIIKYASNNPAE